MGSVREQADKRTRRPKHIQIVLMLFDFDNKSKQVKLDLIKVINKTTQDRCHDYTSTHYVDGFEKKLFNTSVIFILTVTHCGQALN